jgi:hypothetical protein
VNVEKEPEVTRFEAFLQSRTIKPARLAAASGYTRQHLLRLRRGSGRATRRCMTAIANGWTQLLGRRSRWRSCSRYGTGRRAAVTTEGPNRACGLRCVESQRKNSPKQKTALRGGTAPGRSERKP